MFFRWPIHCSLLFWKHLLTVFDVSLFLSSSAEILASGLSLSIHIFLKSLLSNEFISRVEKFWCTFAPQRNMHHVRPLSFNSLFNVICAHFNLFSLQHIQSFTLSARNIFQENTLVHLNSKIS